MVTFKKTALGRTESLVKLNILDIGFVLLILLLTFLVSSLWMVQPTLESIPLIKSIALGVIMIIFSSLSFMIYIIGALTGSMRALKIMTPTWLIGAALSIPVWVLVNIFLPLSSSIGVAGSENVLLTMFGPEVFNFIQLVWVYAVVESLLLGILLLFFMKIAAVTGKETIIFSFSIVVIFMALLHGAIAMALDQSGAFDFNAIIIYQFISFAIMGIIFLSPLGMPGNIAAHQVKNLMALRLPFFPFWVLLFLAFLFFTIIAVKSAKGADASVARAAAGGLGV